MSVKSQLALAIAIFALIALIFVVYFANNIDRRIYIYDVDVKDVVTKPFDQQSTWPAATAATEQEEIPDIDQINAEYQDYLDEVILEDIAQKLPEINQTEQLIQIAAKTDCQYFDVNITYLNQIYQPIKEETVQIPESYCISDNIMVICDGEKFTILQPCQNYCEDNEIYYWYLNENNLYSMQAPNYLLEVTDKELLKQGLLSGTCG